MSFEWYDRFQKGIRVKSLCQIVLLMAKYCYGHDGIPFIDFEHRFRHSESSMILDKLSDVTKLFMEKEGMSKRRAYDYAKTIKQIQSLTR